MEKNNSKVIITILSVLVLCLAGFIVYDKTLNNNSKENTNNCPKCENSSSNTNNYGEKISSFKEIKLTTENQTIKIGNRQIKIKTDDFGELFINDYDEKITVSKAYLTDKFIFFTGFGQDGEMIRYFLNEHSNFGNGFNDNEYQMQDFKLVDGYVRATGHVFCGLDCNIINENLVIKYIDNTLIVIPE